MFCADSAHERRCVRLFGGSFDTEVFRLTRHHRGVSNTNVHLRRFQGGRQFPFDARNQVLAELRLNGCRRRAVPDRGGGPSGARGRTIELRQRGEVELIRCQSDIDGASHVLWQGRVPLLPRVPDRVPGPQYQLGAALHGDGHLVEEEPPVERRPHRNRHRIRGQRKASGSQGAAKCLEDGIVGMFVFVRRSLRVRTGFTWAPHL